ncbi:hypothetical protein [Amycolatopsis sp. NPDC051071]|uniref:hypothetical protein n=1 Tax=Amycolatopsis sp. NPDC051071 TaxID=3154637 RepID=UPI003445F3C3
MAAITVSREEAPQEKRQAAMARGQRAACASKINSSRKRIPVGARMTMDPGPGGYRSGLAELGVVFPADEA